MGDGDEKITIEDTNKLVYLEQVLKETLRLFPIAPMFLRKLQDEVKIGELLKNSITTCYSTCD
jgi:cytochrome P450 family 4